MAAVYYMKLERMKVHHGHPDGAGGLSAAVVWLQFKRGQMLNMVETSN